MTSLQESITEAEFQRTVIDYAKLRGWQVHHTRPSISGGRWTTAIQGDAGFPDLCMARDGVVVLAELKSEKGRVSKDQKRWLHALDARRSGNAVRPSFSGEFGAFLWRPSDWDEIEEVLK